MCLPPGKPQSPGRHPRAPGKAHAERILLGTGLTHPWLGLAVPVRRGDILSPFTPCRTSACRSPSSPPPCAPPSAKSPSSSNPWITSPSASAPPSPAKPSPTTGRPPASSAISAPTTPPGLCTSARGWRRLHRDRKRSIPPTPAAFCHSHDGWQKIRISLP